MTGWADGYRARLAWVYSPAPTSRALTTVEEYLQRTRPPERQGSRPFTAAAIAEHGREAVAALGDRPTVTIATKSDEIIAVVARTPPDAIPAETMTLSEYLPSRTAKLMIHGLDMHTAAALSSLSRCRPRRQPCRGSSQGGGPPGRSPPWSRPLRGRAELPEGFSV